MPRPSVASPVYINERRSRIPNRDTLGKVWEDTLFGQSRIVLKFLNPTGKRVNIIYLKIPPDVSCSSIPAACVRLSRIAVDFSEIPITLITNLRTDTPATARFFYNYATRHASFRFIYITHTRPHLGIFYEKSPYKPIPFF